jgi:hypothetical protein
MVVLVWNAHAKEQRLWEQKMGRPR